MEENSDGRATVLAKIWLREEGKVKAAWNRRTGDNPDGGKRVE